MLAFRETGPSGGVPVVLLHALGSKAGTWDDFAARLDRRVVAVDLPGHGDSAHVESYSLDAMADGVAELLGEEADLVGHSMGGRVAVLLAQRLPGRVRRLVVEDTPPPPLEALEPLAPAQEPSGPLPFDWRLIDPIMTELRTPDPAWWERLGVITAPTLLISGGPSSHVGRESLERMCGLIPDCRLVVVEDAGHRVHGSRPEEFAAVAGEFLGPA
ncbi:alpha/beta fold hydrolase [Amycolatopsis keratiniphila]|uniref:Alpha/beta hydrolase n=1 Tax=Amycolatopsis keratiniphila subsp. keratiniphila TaxID=227715 RepID=A0A1W2M065_9PSEU|nr:alpha/beta hydrolase [Amycolatopsis keratiniphila]ONF73023.1 alpha/beta hydrolase [Amycolatopsis keratiniphila subsp. keratiniphila]